MPPAENVPPVLLDRQIPGHPVQPAGMQHLPEAEVRQGGQVS